MRPWLFKSIYPALLVVMALLMVSQLVHAQTINDHDGQTQVLYRSPTHELGIHRLHAHQLEARARHRAEMLALERAAEELRIRAYDAAIHSPGEASLTWPEDALGVVHINRPREMTLLQLRGLAGAGTALLRLNDGCVSVPLRFVAGDFGGQQINARRAPPVRIAIRSQQVVEMLLNGDDVVSGDYTVSSATSSGRDKADAELVLLDGLTIDHGFVINPGRSVIDDIFGVQGLYVPCEL